MNILDKIVGFKKKEVEKSKGERSINALKESPLYGGDCVSMVEYLQRQDKSGIIAEFKRKSPSKSNINLDASVMSVTQGYCQAGASGLSILTDEYFFEGKNEDLRLARIYNTCPILRKDFIIDEYQIHEAKSIGADTILLIAEILSKENLFKFASIAKSLGLEVLMEIHSKDQLEKYNKNVDIVGVNNRNLETFTVDIETSIKLFEEIPSEVMKISESGISNIESILKLKKVGFQGFLIGEHFMASKDPAQKCRQFIEELNSSQVNNIIVNP